MSVLALRLVQPLSGVQNTPREGEIVNMSTTPQSRNQQTQQDRPVNEYRAHLTIPQNNVLCSLKGTSLDDVQGTIRQLLGTAKTTFTEHDDNTVFIYSRDHNEGRAAIGWITQQAVPESLSVRTLTEQRMKRAA